MNRYETKVPRLTIGFAAATLTALTFGLAVYVPVAFDAANGEMQTVAAARAVMPHATVAPPVTRDLVTASAARIREPGTVPTPRG